MTPKLELNVIAKPKGDWTIPTTIGEVRFALSHGKCVETYVEGEGEWFVTNPFTNRTDERIHLWLLNDGVRIDNSRKLLFHRLARYRNLDGITVVEHVMMSVIDDLMTYEDGQIDFTWLTPRAFIIVPKETLIV